MSKKKTLALFVVLPGVDGKLAILHSLEGVLGLHGNVLAELGHCIPELVELVPNGLINLLILGL